MLGVCDGGQIRTAGHGVGLGGQLVYGVAISTCEACGGAGCPPASDAILTAARLAKAELMRAE
jgi:hypothetical protein